MTNTNCSCTTTCSALSIVASVIIGIITAFLAFTATINICPVFLWTLFVVSIVWLALFVITTARGSSKFKACICRHINKLIVGILGTILVSVILLTICFCHAWVLVAILKGLLFFFFSLTVTSTACIIKCAADCDDE